MRLNISLSDIRFIIFNINGIKGLQEIKVQNSQACKYITFILLIVSLYFELYKKP